MQLQVRLTRSTSCSRMDTSIFCLARISSMTLYRQATDMQEELKVNFLDCREMVMLQADQAQTLLQGVSWSGGFPMLRGGVVTFSLKPTEPFCISVQPEATFSAAGALVPPISHPLLRLWLTVLRLLRGELLLVNFGNLCHKHTNAFSVNVQARIRMQAGWGCLSTRNLRMWSCVTRGLSKWCQLLTCASKPPPPQVLYQLCS